MVGLTYFPRNYNFKSNTLQSFAKFAILIALNKSISAINIQVLWDFAR